MVASKDTIPVREGEELDLEIVEKLIRSKIDGLSQDTLQVEQFSFGSSNLTYQLSIGDWEAVLRTPPHGPLPPKAHNMEREYKILKEINPLYPIAPKPYMFYEGDELEKPFFLMERKRGIVIDDEFPKGMKVSEDFCWNLSEIMVDALVELHSIDYEKTNLINMTNPDGFMERQVHGWINRYERARIDDAQGYEALKKWLVDNIPEPQAPTIIHYDFKFNNLMFNENFSEIVGLFDWEMTSVGDPLADLGVALSYWHDEESVKLLKQDIKGSALTILPGFMTRDDFIQDYAKKSGRDVSNILFYQKFAFFKLAVLCQQIYYRWKMGQTKDQRFSKLNLYVNNLIKYALAISK